MPKASISEMLRTSPLMRPNERDHALLAVRDMQVFRDQDVVRGTISRSAGSQSARSGSVGARLSKLIAERKGMGRYARAASADFAKDSRQRVVVTVYFQKHFGAGAAGKLVAHGKYLERDGAGPDGDKGQAYDREHDGVEMTERLEEWGNEDKRHFRLMLAPESGARIADLKDFTRATMARMERDLGAELDWMAVDHHNTDNPHVHIVLRGRRRDGVELIIPANYATQGLRYAARDVATEMLGARGPDDERLALDRETRAVRHNRLDQMLEAEVRPDRSIRIQAIGRERDPVLRAALRNRVRELAHMGLAREVKRGSFRFDRDWAARLEEVGKGIDIRRRLGREVEPGKGKLKLYRAAMGRLTGSVVEAGRRGEAGKGYVIIVDQKQRPVLANVREREAAGLEPGAIISLEPKEHQGRGLRVRLDRLSETPLSSQIEARAETELDRDIARVLAGEPQRLPSTGDVRKAVTERVAWHQREGSGRRDLTGRFEFEPGALDRLRASELANAEAELGKAARKRVIGPNDGLEREWRVRGFVQLQQGRFAALERSDAVALVRLSRSLSLKQGKLYSLSITGGKIKVTPSLGLDR